MRRSLVIALLILLAAGVMASGATPFDDAKKSVATADKKVAANASELQTLTKSLAQHVTALADISRQLDAIRIRQRQAAPIIAKALEAVNAELVIARTEATAADRGVRGAETALATAQGDVAAKRAAIERAASTERKAFESSDVFKETSAKVATADAALARERARIDAARQNNPAVTQLKLAVSKAEANLTTARSKAQPDDGATAEASANWIAAKNAMTTADAKAYADDGAFVAAQKAAAAATATRTTLSDAFDKSILNQPGVADAQLAFRDAQAAVKLAEANVTAARDALERAGRWLITQRTSADAIGQIARGNDDAIAQTQADLKRAQDEVRGVGQDLTTAVTGVLGIRDDLKDAADAIKLAEKKK